MKTIQGAIFDIQPICDFANIGLKKGTSIINYARK